MDWLNGEGNDMAGRSAGRHVVQRLHSAGYCATCGSTGEASAKTAAEVLPATVEVRKWPNPRN